MSVRKWFLKLRLFCGLVLPVLLAGCATTVADPLAAPLTAEQSAVVVTVTNNTTIAQRLDELTVRRLDSGQEFLLKQTGNLSSRDTTLFVGVLPAGEYQLATVRDDVWSRTVKLQEGPGLTGNFRVVGGAPTDLGRLIVTPINFKAVVGRSSRVISNYPLIRGFAPEYARLFEKEAAGGWVAPIQDEDNIEDYARSRPGDVGCITEADGGIVLAGARLGTLMQRQPNGKWQGLRGNSIAALNCALPVNLPNAELLVAGEFGTLLRRAKGDATLRQVQTGDLPAGNLLRIVGNSQGGWYVANLRGDTVTLYHSPELESGKWTEVRRDKVDRLMGNFHYRYWIWPTANGLAYTTGRGAIQMLDFATKRWDTVALPENESFTELALSPNGMIAMRAKAEKHYVSHDAGKHWEVVKASLQGSYVDTGSIQQRADGSMVIVGQNLAHQSALFRSWDKGQSWRAEAGFRNRFRVAVLKSAPMLRYSDDNQDYFMTLSTPMSNGYWTDEFSTYDSEYAKLEEQRKRK
jgi:hypothetical protein